MNSDLNRKLLDITRTSVRESLASSVSDPVYHYVSDCITNSVSICASRNIFNHIVGEIKDTLDYKLLEYEF